MFKRLILVIMLCALSVCSASAHPGRTDGEGGHWDSSAGEYHYHHGYSAHYHTNGYCPYYYDDKTGWNSGTSSSNSNQSSSATYPPITKPKSDTKTDAKKEQTKNNNEMSVSSGNTQSLPKEKEQMSIVDIVIQIITVIILIPFLIYLFFAHVVIGLLYLCAGASCLGIIAHIFTSIPKLISFVYQKSVFVISYIPLYLETRREKIKSENEQKAEFISLYGGKTLAECSGMPSDVEIGEDGLPKERDADGWGQRFTFYISPKGKSYHCRCGCSNAQTPIHAFKVRWRYSPCKRCNPQLPDLDWYAKYNQIQTIKRNYNID